MALCLKPLNPVHFPGGVIEIPGEGVYVGRDAGNAAKINESAVSSRHARLALSEDGKLTVEDCDSSNGTFVNGRPVKEESLSEGDVVKFATASFRVLELNGHVPPAVPESSGINLPEAESVKVTAPQPLVAPETDSKLEEENATLTSVNEALKSEVKLLKQELAQARENEKQVSNRLNASLEEVSRELQTTSRDLNESREREERTGNQLSSVREELMQKERDIASYSYELSQRDGSLARLQAEVDQLNDELIRLRATQRETSDALEQKSSALMVALQRAEAADSSRAELFARTARFVERLLEDWKAWFPESDLESGASDEEVEVVFAKAEKVADAIRSELDSIEPIWHEFGDGVQGELKKRCADLEAERLELERRKNEQRGLFDQATEDLKEIQTKVNNEVRRAQSLSRKGTEVAIPERFESMVIATDREEEIFTLLVERVDALDLLAESYAKSKKYKDVYLELTAFHDSLAEVLNENGVTPFVVEEGTVLTPKLRKDVQILVKKGWGTREYMEQPFRRGEVKRVVRHGYRIAEGTGYKVLRKVEVLIREIDD